MNIKTLILIILFEKLRNLSKKINTYYIFLMIFFNQRKMNIQLIMKWKKKIMEAETVENKLNISLINLGRWKIYGIERKTILNNKNSWFEKFKKKHSLFLKIRNKNKDKIISRLVFINMIFLYLLK